MDSEAGDAELADSALLNDPGSSKDSVHVRDNDRMGEARLAELTETGELAGDEGVAVDNTAVEEEEEPMDPQDLADMLAAMENIVDKDKEPEPGA
jgi:hypothetical protein